VPLFAMTPLAPIPIPAAIASRGAGQGPLQQSFTTAPMAAAPVHTSTPPPPTPPPPPASHQPAADKLPTMATEHKADVGETNVSAAPTTATHTLHGSGAATATQPAFTPSPQASREAAAPTHSPTPLPDTPASFMSTGTPFCFTATATTAAAATAESPPLFTPISSTVRGAEPQTAAGPQFEAGGDPVFKAGGVSGAGGMGTSSRPSPHYSPMAWSPAAPDIEPGDSANASSAAADAVAATTQGVPPTFTFGAAAVATPTAATAPTIPSGAGGTAGASLDSSTLPATPNLFVFGGGGGGSNKPATPAAGPSFPKAPVFTPAASVCLRRLPGATPRLARTTWPPHRRTGSAVRDRVRVRAGGGLRCHIVTRRFGALLTSAAAPSRR
jgi:hypothetical protein